jgi:hypothetical protein
MRKLTVKQLSYDLTPVAGLALVGPLLHALQAQLHRVDAALPVTTGVRTSDVLRSYVGLLACGWLPLDIDTFAMDNSGTAKEGVGRTDAGVDG